MKKILDMRDADFSTVSHACDIIMEYQKTDPDIDTVIISRSQKEKLVRSDPTWFTAALMLEQQFEKPMSDLDFKMILEKCEVVIE